MTPYSLLKSAIEKKTQTKESLMKKANVFLMTDQLTDIEYQEIVGLINLM